MSAFVRADVLRQGLVPLWRFPGQPPLALARPLRNHTLNGCFGDHQPQRRRHSTKKLDKKDVTIGFIGLGQMGFHMATNMHRKAGCQMVVFDLSPGAVEKFAAAAASSSSSGGVPQVRAASSLAELAEQSDVIVSMLPASRHVLEAYDGPRGVLQGLRKGSLVIDCSTIDTEVAESVVKKVNNSGSAAVDAPVSGGTVGAQEGTLTFMVGAQTEEDFLKAKPWLGHMGKNFVHCGGPGMGQAAKICNNMLLGITMIGTSETINLGVKMGLDPFLLSRIINTSSGRSWSSEVNNPHPGVLPGAPASRDYEGGFGVALMAKDMGLATDAARKAGATTMLGAAAHQIYSHVARQEGYQKKDFSSVYRWMSSPGASSAKSSCGSGNT